MLRGLDQICSHCHRDKASLYRFFWSCPNRVLFLSAILETFSNICSKQRRPDTLFGVAPGVFAVTGAQCDALAFLSLLAQWLVLIHWKSAKPPLHCQWVQSVMAHLKLKTSILHNGLCKDFFKSLEAFPLLF